jgi:hypothetical protein
MGGVGVEGAGGATHFIVFGGVLTSPANLKSTMEDLRRTMTLANPPSLFIAPSEIAKHDNKTLTLR